MSKLTQVQARMWIREHLAAYIENCDCAMGNAPGDVPDEVFALWQDETRKAADRLRRTIPAAFKAGEVGR